MKQHVDGCYHDMIKYLSEITGISALEEIEIDGIEKVTSWNHRLNIVLNGQLIGQVRPEFRKGGIKVLKCIDPYSAFYDQDIATDTKFDRIYYTQYRDVNAFKVHLQPAGTYKDSLGGGWHSDVSRVQVRDKYFAYMECNCF